MKTVLTWEGTYMKVSSRPTPKTTKAKLIVKFVNGTPEVNEK